MKTNLFLKRIEELKINPNFFCSEPYFAHAKLKTITAGGWVRIEDEGLIVFPAVPITDLGLKYPYKDNWSDFESFLSYKPVMKKTFLDYEFFYDPKNFLDLSGGEWQTFRKNSRKWLREQKGEIEYSTRKDIKQIGELLENWVLLMDSDGERLEDGETIVNYALTNRKDVYTKYLYNGFGKLVGINIADENYQYINFRYTISSPEPYLDEYMRLLFYTDLEIQNKNKLVNDGGCLGKKTLYNFKKKLNPFRIKLMYSETI